MTSAPLAPRLRFRRVAAPDAAALHDLAVDPHIRRYLLDGQLVDRSWSDTEIHRSTMLFAARGVGLWLVFPVGSTGEPIGFGGYRIFEDLDPRPQLLYALRESWTGRRLGTELATALVEFAVAKAGFEEVPAATDEPNIASVRVLENVGFRRTGHTAGPFGRTLLFTYRPTWTPTSTATPRGR